MTAGVSSIRRNLTLVLLLFVAALSYIDRQVFTLFQDDIKVDLGLSDSQLGMLTGLSFAVFYSLAAFPVARYADRGDRGLVVAVSVTIWSLATALCGAASGFWTMVLARVGLAAGEAGAGPASNSLLVDIFPRDRRVMVISAYLAASALGISGGLALGGWLSQFYGWRTVFYIVGLPGVLIGLAVWLFAVEPRRTATKAVVAPPRMSSSDVFRTMLTSTSLRWVATLLIAVPCVGGAFLLWSPSFFLRVHHMDKESVGYWLGGATLFGLVLGNLTAGFVGDRFGRDNPGFNGWFAGLGLLAAFPFSLGFILSPDTDVSLACLLALNFLMTLHLGPIIALCFSQVPTAMRAVMSATINMFIGLAGTGIGGTLAGTLSDLYTARFGTLSLRYSLLTFSGGLLIGGLAAIMAGRTAKPLAQD
jgi:MFS family permease